MSSLELAYGKLNTMPQAVVVDFSSPISLAMVAYFGGVGGEQGGLLRNSAEEGMECLLDIFACVG